MHKILVATIGLMAFSLQDIKAQESQLGRWASIQKNYQELFFEEALYANQSLLDEVEKKRTSIPIMETYPRLQVQSVQYQLISDFRSKKNGSLEALVQFSEKNSNHPELWPTFMELGTYYYNQRAYHSSIAAFDRINTHSLSDEDWLAMHFKKGYCHFVQQEFAQAARSFAVIKDLNGDFFYPSNYYSGMCSYFEGDYEEAVRSFNLVSSSSLYRSMIPYYVSQIYFAQGEFDLLIPYGEKAILQAETENKKEIRLLLGQAYFKKNQFDLSLPHLEYYEENTIELTQEEFYQLAFTQYQLSLYEKAQENFVELTFLDSEMGQVASYYLADCYQRGKDMSSARAAYKKVSQMDYIPSMRDEAHFNYGKLSAELNFDREAINSLINIKKESLFYSSAQNIINDVLSSTDDYNYALNTIESFPLPISQELQATYQDLAFRLGLISVIGNDFEEARTYFEKVNLYPVDQRKLIESQFWRAQILHKEMQYSASIDAFAEYFDMSNGQTGLSYEASPHFAHYSQAYNFLKREDFDQALFHFKSAIVGISLAESPGKNDKQVQLILDDSYIRSGDCYFKGRDFQNAKLQYQESISRSASGKVYAMYQKGLIEGLLGEPYQKVLSMQDIISNHPEDAYADDALMQLGEVYLSLGSSYKAKEAFEKVYTRYGDRRIWTNQALLKMGLIDYNQGDIESAINTYKNVFKHEPSAQESQAAIRALEEIYVEDLGKAEDYFEFLASIPDYEIDDYTKDSLEYKVALVRYEQALYEEAILSFTNYLSKFENGYFKIPAHYYRGESHASVKAYSNALLDYEKIIESKQGKYLIQSLRKAAIISYNHVKDFRKSYTYYNQIVDVGAEKDILYEASIGALESAYRANSIEGVAKYRDLLQENELANDFEKTNAEFYYAKLNQSYGNRSIALDAYRSVAKATKNESGAEARYQIASLLFQNGDIEEAEAQCMSNNQEMGGYSFWIAKNLLLIADIYLSRDEVLNARAAVEAVLENFTEDSKITALAEAKLKAVNDKAEELNRIKAPPTDGTLELDTSRSN